MAYSDFEIKVGEEVGMVRRNRSYGGISFQRFGTVSKINGHGHIYVQTADKEYRFDRRGNAYKDDWGPHLIHAASLRAELEVENRRKEQMRIAREIEDTIAKGRSYSGRFFATQERVDALKNLVAELEKLVDA